MRIALVLVLVLTSACVGSIGDNPIQAKKIELEQVATELSLSASGGFADERGGGIFADSEGTAVRLRSDGSKAKLESHPGNAVVPGAVQRVFPTGPFSALVLAENGLYAAESGWLIEPAWQEALSPAGVVAVAMAGDGIAWIAHERGLFRLEAGALSELKAGGKSLSGISALAVAPADDGANAVWFAQGESLSVAKQVGRTRYEVAASGLEKDLLRGKILALGGVSAAPRSDGQLWLISEGAVLSHGEQGWVRYATEGKPSALLCAGRWVWVRVGDALYRYDVDAEVWGEVASVRAPTFLAADASGTVWVRVAEQTLQLRPRAVPRVLGLFENARVYTPDIHLRAQLPIDENPLSVTFTLDDGEKIERSAEQAIIGEGALKTWDFALGGFDAAGREKSFSLAGLGNGLHSLTIEAKFEDGQTRRALHFELRTGGGGALSYEKDVRPIFEARCAKCHDKGPGHLLRTYEQWASEKDKILAAVLELRMPADGPLDPAQIQLLQRWASGGALP